MDSPNLHDTTQSQDPQLEYEIALLDYRKAIEAIQKAGESVSVEQIRAAIEARDQIHVLLAKLQPSYKRKLVGAVQDFSRSLQQLLSRCLRIVSLLIQGAIAFLTSPSNAMRQRQVRALDSMLKLQSGQIRRVVNSDRTVRLSELAQVLESAQPQWLNLFKSVPPWHDRYDWLWRGISLICFVWAVALLADTVNRFLAGGVSTGGVAAILGTVFLTLLSSGGVVSSFGQGELEKVFGSFNLPEKWWDEARCLLSVLILILLILFREYGLPVSSNCYASEPEQIWFVHCFKQPDLRLATSRYKVTTRESRYQRAIALNPDNFSAYFRLAQLYENELDYDNALKTYQSAARVASDADKSQAEDGVIRTLIRKDDLRSADALLEENLKDIDKISDDQYEVLKQLGQAYLEKGRAQQNAFKQLSSYVNQAQNSQAVANQAGQPPISNDNLASAVKWFDKGVRLSKPTVNSQKRHQMQLYLAWSYWEQNDWIKADSSATDAIRIQGQQNALPFCILTNARIAQAGYTTLSAKFRNDSFACGGIPVSNDSEFYTITQQLKQLNKPFEPK